MPRAVVSLTCYRSERFLRAAVDSILVQTMDDLVLVVINDGGPPPWDVLRDVSDPRLVRFDLADNHGTYFAHEVVLRAVDAQYFVVQDSDDTSRPHRIATLIDAIESTDAIAAASWIRGCYNACNHRRNRREVGDPTLRHRWPHVGLQRTAELRKIGGYYGGYRTGWDTLIMNAVALAGELRPGAREESIAFVEEALYRRNRRPDSLSQATTTRGSDHQHTIYQAKWTEILAARGRPELPEVIRRAMTADVSHVDEAQLQLDAARLRAEVGRR